MSDPFDHPMVARLAAVLGAIVKMSDDVVQAKSPLDAQGKLLFMQNSIQKHAKRIGQELIAAGARQ